MPIKKKKKEEQETTFGKLLENFDSKSPREKFEDIYKDSNVKARATLEIFADKGHWDDALNFYKACNSFSKNPTKEIYKSIYTTYIYGEQINVDWTQLKALCFIEGKFEAQLNASKNKADDHAVKLSAIESNFDPEKAGKRLGNAFDALFDQVLVVHLRELTIDKLDTIYLENKTVVDSTVKEESKNLISKLSSPIVDANQTDEKVVKKATSLPSWKLWRPKAKATLKKDKNEVDLIGEGSKKSQLNQSIDFDERREIEEIKEEGKEKKASKKGSKLSSWKIWKKAETKPRAIRSAVNSETEGSGSEADSMGSFKSDIYGYYSRNK